jgi:predicted nucleic acid-binding protein
MIYVDTSVIVKLYIREDFSRKASEWLRKNNEAIPLTFFHELEFMNALKLKQFRREMTGEEAENALLTMKEHEARGVYHRPPVNWTDTFTRGLDLSKAHTSGLGARSLDILHVALALSIGADRFLSLDDRQSKLASAAGMRIEALTS